MAESNPWWWLRTAWRAITEHEKYENKRSRFLGNRTSEAPFSWQKTHAGMLCPSKLWCFFPLSPQSLKPLIGAVHESEHLKWSGWTFLWTRRTLIYWLKVYFDIKNSTGTLALLLMATNPPELQELLCEWILNVQPGLSDCLKNVITPYLSGVWRPSAEPRLLLHYVGSLEDKLLLNFEPSRPAVSTVVIPASSLNLLIFISHRSHREPKPAAVSSNSVEKTNRNPQWLETIWCTLQLHIKSQIYCRCVISLCDICISKDSIHCDKWLL